MAKALDEELEDLKTLAKSLEEQNRSLMAQARHTVSAWQGTSDCREKTEVKGQRLPDFGSYSPHMPPAHLPSLMTRCQEPSPAQLFSDTDSDCIPGSGRVMGRDWN